VYASYQEVRTIILHSAAEAAILEIVQRLAKVVDRTDFLSAILRAVGPRDATRVSNEWLAIALILFYIFASMVVDFYLGGRAYMTIVAQLIHASGVVDVEGLLFERPIVRQDSFESDRCSGIP
jgi:predicted methyltransferase